MERSKKHWGTFIGAQQYTSKWKFWLIKALSNSVINSPLTSEPSHKCRSKHRCCPPTVWTFHVVVKLPVRLAVTSPRLTESWDLWSSSHGEGINDWQPSCMQNPLFGCTFCRARPCFMGVMKGSFTSVILTRAEEDIHLPLTVNAVTQSKSTYVPHWLILAPCPPSSPLTHVYKEI